MLSEALFERAVSWSAASCGDARLLELRRGFEERTGPIEESALDYESRIAHFFEWYLCSSGNGEQPVASFARAHPELSWAERKELAGWLRSHRSLWTMGELEAGGGWVHDLLGGLSVRVSLSAGDGTPRVGDRFDGRVIPIGDTLYLSPGRVFHPREAHGALDRLLEQARASGALGPGLLDPLLRMRSSFLGFASIRAEHVYRLDAVSDRARSAPWARNRAR